MKPIFTTCNVCGRELVRQDELAVGMCAVCANETIPEPAKPKTKGILVHVHCGQCDWDGMGDPDDACYGCGDVDSLREVHPDRERCGGCGRFKPDCDCDDMEHYP